MGTLFFYDNTGKSPGKSPNTTASINVLFIAYYSDYVTYKIKIICMEDLFNPNSSVGPALNNRDPPPHIFRSKY